MSSKAEAAPRASLPSILQEVQKLHVMRVKTYGEFEQAFKDFLHSKDEAHFKAQANLATRSFQGINNEMKELELQLTEDHKREDLSKMIRQIQDFEKQNFVALNKIQQIQVENMKKKHQHDHDEGECAHSHAHGKAEDEEEEEDPEKEALVDKELQDLKLQRFAAKEGINELMEALQYELAELTGQEA